jgi:hypothetical protein
MREKIIKELRLTLEEANKKVSGQIPEIKRKAMRSASAVQYYKDEANRLVNYKNSDSDVSVCEYYVGKGYPKFNNTSELIDFMAEYYEHQAEWILNRMAMRGYEPTEENLLSDMMEDASIFLEKYLLERSLLKWAEDVLPEDIMALFYSPLEARLFCNDILDCRKKKGKVQGVDIKNFFQAHSPHSQPKFGGVPMKRFAASLVEVGLITIGYEGVDKGFNPEHYLKKKK